MELSLVSTEEILSTYVDLHMLLLKRVSTWWTKVVCLNPPIAPFNHDTLACCCTFPLDHTFGLFFLYDVCKLVMFCLSIIGVVVTPVIIWSAWLFTLSNDCCVCLHWLTKLHIIASLRYNVVSVHLLAQYGCLLHFSVGDHYLSWLRKILPDLSVVRSSFR